MHVDSVWIENDTLIAEQHPIFAPSRWQNTLSYSQNTAQDLTLRL